MKVLTLTIVVAVLVFVECRHTFMGTNFFRPLAYHKEVKFSSRIFQKRVEYVNVTMPSSIQGILAYDLTNSDATANVTRGGLGYNFVDLRMKSERGKKLDYDVYVYI